MLELALTRFEDRTLFPFEQMKGLVLDEVHTYSGRQGADMACLVRRRHHRRGCSVDRTCGGGAAADHVVPSTIRRMPTGGATRGR